MIAEYQHWGSVELSTKISYEVFTGREVEYLARLVAGVLHAVNVGGLRARFVETAVVGDEADILRSIVLAEQGYGIGLNVGYRRHKGNEPTLILLNPGFRQRNGAELGNLNAFFLGERDVLGVINTLVVDPNQEGRHLRGLGNNV